MIPINLQNKNMIPIHDRFDITVWVCSYAHSNKENSLKQKVIDTKIHIDVTSKLIKASLMQLFCTFLN